MVSHRLITAKGSGRARDILEASREILVEKGFAGLSYGEIAKRVGMTVGNVNYYYPAKEGLMVDLAELIFDRWDERFRAAMPQNLTQPLEVFVYAIKYMIEENKRPKTMALLIEMWAMANQSDPVAKMMDAFYVRMRTWIEALLAKVNPAASAKQRCLRAALITAQIEGLMVLVGPRRVPHRDLKGIEALALAHIERLARSE